MSPKIRGRGPEGKAIVFGLLERESGKVRTSVVGGRRKHHLHAEIRANVEPKAALYTDALKSYDGLNGIHTHQVVDHAEKYIDGAVHTNRLENFRSLLKRAITEPMLLSRSICSDTLMNDHFATTSVTTPTLKDSPRRFARLAESARCGKR